jgi:transglutaminase-like putative cysteine protease
MKKVVILLLVLLTLPSAFGLGDEVFRSEYLNVDFNISSKINVIPETEGYKLSYLNAELTYFPENDERQNIISQYTVPASKKNNGSLVFSWENVKQDVVLFSVNSKIRIQNKQFYIPRKIDFPIKNVPEEAREYTKQTQVIDSENPRIISLASSLAEGESDMLAVVFKIGNWTKNNIAYDLSTQTANVSQKASWVLENRVGVCDELTSLFIAMLRSVKIPARFVAGYAYTNSLLFKERWGPHGWAEVYFPGYGWVPFDVTYGELGYIDASHIKLKAAADPNMSSTSFEWGGRFVGLQAEPLKFTVKEGDFGKALTDSVKLESTMLYDSVGFGSHNVVITTIENPTQFYVAEEVMISKTESTEIIGVDKKLVLLKPGERKQLYWVIRIDNNLNKDYSYKFPITVYTVSNIQSKTYFNSMHNDPIYPLEDVKVYVNNRAGTEEKVYADGMEISCDSDKESYHVYETLKIICQVTNTGNTILSGLSVCMKDNCTTINLGITQTGTVRFEYKPENVLDKGVKVTIKNDKISKVVKINAIIQDIPSAEIVNLNYPKNATYNDIFEIKFDLNKTSVAKPKNVTIAFHSDYIKQNWPFGVLTQKRSFVIQAAGRQMKEGKNTFYIDVRFYDDNLREYTTSGQFDIYLARPTFWQRIMMFFSRII